MSEKIKGRVHSFETFGTVDGPGIRFLVFMQGCPLRCLYCHNRDTWDPKGGKEYTVDEIINELQKYSDYIKFSNGGITVTGGEPTLQAEFVAKLFKKCKKLGIHTTLDTSGYVDLEKVENLLKYTDLVLLDIKHGNAQKHKEICGVENIKPRKFAQYLSSQGIPIWIRYVLVPGYTDSDEDLNEAADFIKELKTVEKVEVLPYHTMGIYKWEEMSKDYKLKDVKPPEKKKIEQAKNIFMQCY